MHLAYIDDSGDPRTQVLAVILIEDVHWLDVVDRMVSFRRELSRTTGFRMAREIKASQLVTNGGPWRKLDVPVRTRLGIYRKAIRLLDELHPHVSCFAVVVPWRNHTKLTASAPEDAWEIVLQRLEAFCRHNGSTCFLLPDDGNTKLVRRLARQHRRFSYAPSAYGGPSQRVPFRQLVDDPAHRDSSTNYVMQWADLVAYAAFRRVMPRPDFPPNMWESLGRSLLSAANQIKRKSSDEPEALLVWPERRMPFDPLGLWT